MIKQLTALSTTLIALALLLVFGLSEWTPAALKYSVHCDQDDRLVIDFDQQSIDYRRNPFLLISIVELSPSKPTERSTVWEIHKQDSYTYDKIASVTYGVCPPGFDEKVAPKPLVSGHLYLVSAAPAQVILKHSANSYESISYKQYLYQMPKSILRD